MLAVFSFTQTAPYQSHALSIHRELNSQVPFVLPVSSRSIRISRKRVVETLAPVNTTIALYANAEKINRRHAIERADRSAWRLGNRMAKVFHLDDGIANRLDDCD
jgi:hypothetical protein